MGNGWTDRDDLHDRHRMLSQSDRSTPRWSQSSEKSEVSINSTLVCFLSLESSFSNDPLAMWILSTDVDTRGDSFTWKENGIRSDRCGDLRARSNQMFVPDECLETHCLPARPDETPTTFNGSSFGEVCIRYSHSNGPTFDALCKSSETTCSREDLLNPSCV